MSTVDAENQPGFIGHPNRTRRCYGSALPVSRNSRERGMSGISSTTVFGFLMALGSAALLVLTSQLPWVLPPAFAGLVMAMLVARVSNQSLQV
ncbi:MAG: hypothetical protein KDI83_19150 [Gammaproteobacteria bacterium]|nr:hypothetical protein [Gammaproteobacteria bacterium]